MASAVIVAAGKGLRMQERIRKQYLMLAGIPILTHTLRTFDACPDIREIILVVPQEDADYCRDAVISPFDISKPVRLAAGGSERQDSVRNGLLQVRFHDIAVIHDGVRPFIQPEHISLCIREAEAYGACIFAIPVIDTLKRTDTANMIVETVPRTSLWQAQTPQAFRYDIILKAHETAKQEGFTGTDDASLIERTGLPVKIISGSRLNIKITTQDDLLFAGKILRLRSEF